MRLRSLAVLVLPLALASCTAGAAYTVYTENDYYGLGNRDRYYTNGLRATGLYSADEAPERLSALAAAVPSVSRRTISQVGWVVGQDIYTPADTGRRTPDPDDRPYSGWLYAGVLVSKAEQADDGPAGDSVHVLEVDVGVVGPPSLAKQAQISFHHMGEHRPRPRVRRTGRIAGVRVDRADVGVRILKRVSGHDRDAL